MLGALTRGASVAAIAGLLTFAPMAQQAAQADAALDLSLVASSLGGVLLASPGVLAGATAAESGAVVATTVACAATVVCGGVMVGLGVAALAYTTRDYWVPWVQNTWASSTGGTTGWSSGVGFRTRILPETSGAGVLMRYEPIMSDPRIWGYVNRPVSFDWQCSTSSGGVAPIYRWGFNTSAPDSAGGFYGYWNAGPTPVPFDMTAPMNPCPGIPGSFAGGQVVGVRGSADLGLQSGYVLGNMTDLSWGTLTVVPTAQIVTTDKVCRRPDGSTYTDSRSVSGSTESIPVGYCQPGDTAVSVGVSIVPPGGGSPIVTQTLPLTPTLADVQAYPLCASAGCEYQILLDGVPCKVGMAGCSEWFATSQATPLRVTGRYGPYAFPVSGLTFLKHVYDSKTGVKVTTGTATGTDTGTAPNPIATVAPPLLTDPVPIPSPLPSPSPSPTTTGDCWPTGAAMWNPVDWVMRPIQCALTWAFVPKLATMTALSDVATADLTRVGIAPMAGAVGANLALLGGDNSGCLGPEVTFSAVGIVQPMHPFSACEAPMSTLAGISKAMATVGIIGIGGFALLRAIGAGFGFNVSMGRGKAEGS